MPPAGSLQISETEKSNRDYFVMEADPLISSSTAPLDT